MDQNIKTSILIPVYNREKIISETIESALAQTCKSIEIIIVDNCSTDKTYEICQEFEKKYDRISVYKNNENIGPVRNWLECLKYSTGEYIKFLWSDDWMDNDFIEKTTELLDKDNEIAFVYSPAWIVYENKQKLAFNVFNVDKIFNFNIFEELSILGGNVPVSPGCAIFRKKDVVQNLMVEIPNEDSLIFNKFGAGNDLLLFLLPLLEYKKIGFVYSTRSYFRVHKDSFTCSNNLGLYYDWARLYYLNKKKDEEIIEKFKTNMYLKSLKHKEYKKINKSIVSSINYIFLIKKVIHKLFF
ncbi:glycosyltransferase family 2 protein [Clostridium sp.]|uniref:glycosyltransferase family 2 protein n=1 Tax=Clostridium sp. TaxID=1506 RepID=UPI001A4BF18F|nr:glycosyltransferase family 2 protein [Clostridium sp.]MBK5240996.1 glycosyltransferase family 2 protein [Clostridium sp.]